MGRTVLRYLFLQTIGGRSSYLGGLGGNPPNKSHVTIIVFDSFDPKRDPY